MGHFRLELAVSEYEVVQDAAQRLGLTVPGYLLAAVEEKLSCNNETEQPGHGTGPIRFALSKRKKRGDLKRTEIELPDAKTLAVEKKARDCGLIVADFLRAALNEKLTRDNKIGARDHEAEQRQMEYTADLAIANDMSRPFAERKAARERLAERREASGD